MKFLHTADIHYGAAPDANRPWGKERARAIRDGFARVISVCKSESVDLLIISGGLFDGHPTLEWIEDVDNAFRFIPETKVYIIAGEDDYLFANSPAASYAWSGNVKYCTQSEFTPAVYEELGVTVVGASCDRAHFVKDRIAGAQADAAMASILVLSGENIEEDDIPAGFAYAALGGSHSPRTMRDGRVVNAGAPEPLGPKDTGKHGFYIGEIDIQEKKLAALKLVRRQGVMYTTLAVDVTPASTGQEVEDNIRRALENRGRENIYTLKIRGKCSPEESFELRGIRDDFRIEEIINETEPEYDYVQLFREHPSDMIGLFVKDMNVEERSEIQTKALNYGVAALLRTADERD